MFSRPIICRWRALSSLPIGPRGARRESNASCSNIERFITPPKTQRTKERGGGAVWRLIIIYGASKAQMHFFCCHVLKSVIHLCCLRVVLLNKVTLTSNDAKPTSRRGAVRLVRSPKPRGGSDSLNTFLCLTINDGHDLEGRI